jgi:hypothetical protein
MKFTTIVSFLALALTSVSAATISGKRGCGNDIAASKKAEMEADFDVQLQALGFMRNVPVSTFAAVTIPVWFHVINKGTGVANGDVTQATIDAQIKVLTDTFGGNYVFTLAGVTRTTNSDWFNSAGPGSSKYTEQNVKPCKQRHLFTYSFFLFI